MKELCCDEINKCDEKSCINDLFVNGNNNIFKFINCKHKANEKKCDFKIILIIVVFLFFNLRSGC
jgi:hypothetical protein